ncbi:hypothetical protein C453_00440 [Haloferax elongans ATCC BAA-1513]|uniref:HTTM domain-containing protein n=1 Tax=Haloferax elongans ATCC BAA-1513 TaxID=1230453 RepID=M0I0I8_HALEO|nr:hypothetical protein [Haloferax elongans]ELZ89498.1 hypothetical protein C453_00440 [Haloferax elongans ATCC BAA-1513]
MISTGLTIRLVAGIIGIHAVYSGFEMISVRERYGKAGIMRWEPTRLYIEHIPGFSLIEPLLNRIVGVAIVRVVVGVGLAIAATLNAPVLILGTFATGLLATDFVIVLRHSVGLSGAHQMSLVVSAGLTVAVLAPSGSLLELAGIGFIAAQGILGYFISGVTKGMGNAWRSGDAVLLVLSTTTWGHPWFYEKARSFPGLTALASHGVVLFEIAFPVILLLSPPLVAAIFGVALAMHISIAFAMGINGFITSFSSTYPAIYFVSRQVPTIL